MQIEIKKKHYTNVIKHNNWALITAPDNKVAKYQFIKPFLKFWEWLIHPDLYSYGVVKTRESIDLLLDKKKKKEVNCQLFW